MTTDFTDVSGARVSCRDLWKIYGPHSERSVAPMRSGRLVDGHTAAVREVSFDVEPGETFVVMGLSGSGKSTLVRCLTRLVEPTEGEVDLDGRSVTGMSAAELRELRRGELAMVFQHFGLFPHRRVLDNVAYGLEISGVSRREREAKAREVLELVGLTAWAGHHPAELSGGMRQRVGLARALAVRPRLLLLDEPFSALDPLIRRELQDEMLRLADVMNQTSIFITHDMTEALKIGHRIAIMRDGRFVQVGTPEEIVLRPADDYVRRFSEDASRLRVVQAATVATSAVTVPGVASVTEVLARMGGEHAFAVDPDGRLQGLVTAALLRATSDHTRPVADLATPTEGVAGTAHLERAMQPLIDSPAPVAVVDAGGRVLGAIDRGCLLRALAVATDEPALAGVPA